MMTSNADREAELAAQPLDATDDALLNAVRACYDERDPVPDGLVARVEFALTLAALHAEVATLTQLDLADSGMRTTATDSVRTVTFTSEHLTTTVTLTPLGEDTVRVDGWAAPGADVQVEVMLADHSLATTADSDGRFVFEQVPTGLAKFALRAPLNAPDWVVLSPSIEL